MKLFLGKTELGYSYFIVASNLFAAIQKYNDLKNDEPLKSIELFHTQLIL